MPKKLPSYRHHKASGQGYTEHRGTAHYFGKYGDPESLAKFSRFIAELTALRTADAAASTAIPLSSSPLVGELINAFLDHAVRRYVKDGKPTTEVVSFRSSLVDVNELYGSLPAKEFGPLGLLAVRNRMVEVGLSRKTVNRYVARIVRVWKWGVSQQVVPVATWQALTSLEPLHAGQGRDLPPVRGVTQEAIDAVQPFVSPPIWAMIQFQLWTGCRPHEACQVRECDIDKTHAIWEFRPARWKTQHRGGAERIVYLGPHAQKIVTEWRRDDPKELLWQPRDGRAAWQKTHGGGSPVARGKNQPGTTYTAGSYGRAIERACERAFGMPDEYRRRKTADENKAAAKAWRAVHCWSPNQLRHAAATRIRATYGIEVARIILGHTSAFTTEIYAEQDREKARAAVGESG